MSRYVDDDENIDEIMKKFEKIEELKKEKSKVYIAV